MRSSTIFLLIGHLGIEPGAVDDHIRGPLQGHLLNGEGVAQDVLGQVFEVRLGLGRHLLAGVDVEAAVFPGVEDLHPFGREEFLLDQEVDDLGAEEFFQRLERGVGQGVEVESLELRVESLSLLAPAPARRRSSVSQTGPLLHLARGHPKPHQSHPKAC